MELLLHHVEGYGTGKAFFDIMVQKGHMLPQMDASKVSSVASELLGDKKDELGSEILKIRSDGDWNAVIADILR